MIATHQDTGTHGWRAEVLAEAEQDTARPLHSGRKRFEQAWIQPIIDNERRTLIRNLNKLTSALISDHALLTLVCSLSSIVACGITCRSVPHETHKERLKVPCSAKAMITRRSREE